MFVMSRQSRTWYFPRLILVLTLSLSLCPVTVTADNNPFPVGDHGGQVIDLDPPDNSGIRPPLDPDAPPNSQGTVNQAAGNQRGPARQTGTVAGRPSGNWGAAPRTGAGQPNGFSLPEPQRRTGPQPGLPPHTRDAFGPWERIPDTPVNPDGGNRSSDQPRHDAPARPPVNERLNPDVPGRNAGRAKTPSALDIDELMKKLSDPRLSEANKQRITAVVFYHQDVYRRAVLNGDFDAKSPHVQEFLKRKTQMQLDVIERMGQKFKNRYGRPPKQPIIPFSYNNILSDDDIITGTGDIGRNLEPLYNEALDDIIQERAGRPMTDLDRHRVDVNGLAWNMTLDGAIEDINHPEKYINPQGGYGNKAKLTQAAEAGKVAAYSFDDSGRLVKLDQNGTVRAVEQLAVDSGLKVPGIDAEVGSGAMSDYYRMAQKHGVAVKGANMTVDDVGSFIRNQKYTERLSGAYDDVFQADNKLSDEYRHFLDTSADIRKQTNVREVARILQDAYHIDIIGRGGDLDFNKLAEAITFHERRQLELVMPKMIAAVTQTEAYKIIQHLKTASAGQRRELRKRLAITYAPLEQKALDTITEQINRMPVDEADKAFRLKVLQEDTAQVKQYAKVIGMPVGDFANSLKIKGDNMAVVDLIESKDVTVRKLSQAMDAAKGGSRFRKFLKTRTAAALNLDVLLDTSRENRGSFLFQWGLIYVAASRAYNASQSRTEGLQKVGRVMFEMVPFVAASLRASEGDMREASKEFMMDVMPPLGLASLAVTFFDYAIQEGVINPFTEGQLDELAARMAREFGDAEFEKTDVNGLYRLRNKQQVFEYLDEVSDGLGRIAKLPALLSRQVDAIVSRNTEYQTNEAALAACRWFENFDEEAIGKKYSQGMTLTQFKERVYEQGIPGAESASPVERVAARIILDNKRIRKEAFEKLLINFVWRIERVYNEQKQDGEFDPKEIIQQAIEAINALYDNLPEDIQQSQWAMGEIDADYSARVVKLSDYDGGDQEEYDLKAEMQDYIDGFRQKIAATLKGLEMFREQRYLDLRLQAYGGYDDMEPVSEFLEMNLVRGDVFRLGIAANVNPRRARQKWTVYYYTIHGGGWRVFAKKDINSGKFRPAQPEGNWIMEAPEKETFVTVEGETLEEYFVTERGYHRILAVLAFGDWPADPLAVVGLEAMRDPVGRAGDFPEGTAAFTSPAVEVYTNPPRVSLEIPRFVDPGEVPQVTIKPLVEYYFRKEKARAVITYKGPYGEWDVDQKIELNAVSLDPELPTTVPLPLGRQARGGTYEVQVDFEVPRVLQDLQPFPQSGQFTYLVPEESDGAQAPEEEGGAEEAAGAGMDDYLKRIQELRSSAAGLLAAAESFGKTIQADVEGIVAQIESRMSELRELESAANNLSSGTVDFPAQLSAAQRSADVIQRAGEKAASAHGDARAAALACCQAAGQVKQATAYRQAKAQLATARSEDDRARSAQRNYAAALSAAQADMGQISQAKTALGYDQGKLAQLKTRLAPIESAGALVNADMERLTMLADEVLAKMNALENVARQADSLITEAETAMGSRPAREIKKMFKEIKGLGGQIRNMHKKSEKAFSSANGQLSKPGRKYDQFRFLLDGVKATVNSIKSEQMSAADINQLEQLYNDARAAADAASIFEDAVKQSAQQSAQCLKAAEDHYASELSPEAQVARTDCSGWPGMYAAWNNEQDKPWCYCPSGQVFNESANKCISRQDNAVANADCGWLANSHAVWDSADNRAECWCNDGYEINQAKDRCVVSRDTQVARHDCSQWPGTVARWDANHERPECLCPGGTGWDMQANRCINKRQREVENTNCSMYGPSEPYWDNGRNRVLCRCKFPNVWNRDNTYCVAPQPQMNDAQRCQQAFPGSVPSGRNGNGDLVCNCPYGMTWHNPRAKDYCVPAQSGNGSDGFDDFIDAIQGVTDAINNRNNNQNNNRNTNQNNNQNNNTNRNTGNTGTGGYGGGEEWVDPCPAGTHSILGQCM